MNDYSKITVARKSAELFVSSTWFDVKEATTNRRKLLYMENSRFIEEDIVDARFQRAISEIKIFSGLMDLNDEGTVRIQGGVDEKGFIEILIFRKVGKFVLIKASLDDLLNFYSLK